LGSVVQNETPLYKPEVCSFHYLRGHWIFYCLKISKRSIAVRSTQNLTRNEYQECLLRVKAAGS